MSEAQHPKEKPVEAGKRLTAWVPCDVADFIEATAKADERSVSWTVGKILRAAYDKSKEAA